MRISRLHFSIVMLAALMLLASCGGSSSVLLSEQGSQETFMGIQNGDFKAVRFNEVGYRDSALNPTLDIQTSVSGNTTTVVVGIDDSEPMYGAVVDLHYDTSKYTPTDVKFSGLVEEPLEVSVTKGDLVSLAQASLAGQAKRSGQFAVVTFINEPSKTISAAGDPHLVPVNTMYDAPQLDAANQISGFVVTKATAEDDSPATATIYGTFALGDGDQNGESSGPDLTPMVALHWYNVLVSDTNFAPAIVDYDANGEVSSQDIAIIAAHYTEITTGIEILLGDDDTFADTDAAVDTLAWNTGTYANPTPGAPLTDWADVYRTWTIEATPADLQDADTNGDGTVYVSARAVNNTAVKGPAFTGIPLTYVAIDDRFIIQNITAEIVDGGGTTPVVAGTTLDVIANEELTFNVTGIAGTFEGAPFTPADRGTVVPDADYDATLATVAGLVTWTTDLDEGMIATTEGVANPAVVTGTGQTVMIFPDDDPDYGAGTPEGSLVVQLQASGERIPSLIDFDMDVNVDVDPDVPLISAVSSDQGQVAGGDNWYLNAVGDTLITATFTFGNIVVAEADFEDISVQLFNLADGPVVNLDVITTGDLDAGEAFIREDQETPGTFRMNGIVGLNVIPGATYGLRLAVPDGTASKWTSVNKPGDFFEVAPPPTPVDYATLPGADEVGPSIDALWIYYPDPRIRRNPNVTFADGTVVPEDAQGYQDFIKDNGAEFALTSLGEPHTANPIVDFPVVKLISGTDPTIITSTTEPVAGIAVAMRTPNYTVVDIAAVTPPGMTDTEDYAFKVFGAAAEQANWPNLGTGTFAVAPMDINPADVGGVDFGINIFDDTGRGDLELGDRDYTNKNLNASTVGTGMVDVIFVEFNGGRSDSIDGANNVALVFEDTVSSATMTVPLSVRVVGVGTNGLNRIGVRNFVAADFDSIEPGATGILDPGHTYNVILNSPLQPGSDDYTFADVLVVTGVNPN